MPGRKFNTGSYRHGFNGKEKNPEIEDGNYDFGARMYDSRVGRWWSVDAFASSYPPISPFSFALNSPIIFIDPDGNKVKPMDNESLEIIKLSLTPEEAVYVELTEEGYINHDKLVKGLSSLDNASKNYQDLIFVVADERTVEVHTIDNSVTMDGNGALKSNSDMVLGFADPVSAKNEWMMYGGAEDLTGGIVVGGNMSDFNAFKKEYFEGEDYMPNGTLGLSLRPLGTAPNTTFDAMMLGLTPKEGHKYSTNENYQVLLNKRVYSKGGGLEKTMVETYSHEAYGHILFGLKGESMFHGPKRTCPTDKCEDYNEKLEPRIKEMSKEAGSNYDKHNTKENGDG
jgi:RHS repeat-associated protein